MANHDTCMAIPWQSQAIPRHIQGNSMETPRRFHSNLMSQFHGNPMASPWHFHGETMAIPMQARGKYMAIPWQTHGNSMAISWQFHGKSVAGPLWASCKPCCTSLRPLRCLAPCRGCLVAFWEPPLGLFGPLLGTLGAPQSKGEKQPPGVRCGAP